MNARLDRVALVLATLLSSLPLAASAPIDASDAPQGWTAPPYWTPAAETAGAVRGSRTAFVTSPPLPFVAITPCRQYDSRNDALLANNTPRTVTLIGAPCAIPADAQAVAANITVFDILGAGGNGVFKAGIAAPPVTAWINYPPTETQRANAGVLPLGAGGTIVVQVNQGGGSVDFVVDVFGYYSPLGIVNSLNGQAGDLNLVAGGNVTITPGAGTLSIAAAGATGSTGPIGATGPTGSPGSIGATGPTGLAGPGATWVEVTGTSQQAAPNAGYLANNPAQVTVTLPVSPVVGDVVRVSGLGAGGWKIALNAGQQVMGPLGWTPRAISRNWFSVASSSDGTKLAAVDNNIGFIHTSADSGVTWTPRESPRTWYSVASSSDGVKLVAVENGGQIFTSSDSGTTWFGHESSRLWQAVASSSDGTKLVAAVFGGQVYTSVDSGSIWTPRDINHSWVSVTSSSDGTKLAGAGSQLYTSIDSGVNWTPRETFRTWAAIASSYDGSKLVAVDTGGWIYVSTDSGVTWAPRGSQRNWMGVASSSDGTKLVAVENGGLIYTSTDSGFTWTPRDSARAWRSVASSSDGTKLVAAVQPGGQIYTFPGPTSLGPGGFLTGNADSAIELQFIGSGRFRVLSMVGSVVSQ